MKNLILCISIFSLFLSCGDKNEPMVADIIIGEWIIYSFEMICDDESDNVSLTRADENGCVEVFGDDNCLTLSFFADGTVSVIGDTEKYNYTVNEETKTISLCFDINDCTPLTLIGDQLFLDEDEDDCICTFGFEK